MRRHLIPCLGFALAMSALAQALRAQAPSPVTDTTKVRDVAAVSVLAGTSVVQLYGEVAGYSTKLFRPEGGVAVSWGYGRDWSGELDSRYLAHRASYPTTSGRIRLNIDEVTLEFLQRWVVPGTGRAFRLSAGPTAALQTLCSVIVSNQTQRARRACGEGPFAAVARHHYGAEIGADLIIGSPSSPFSVGTRIGRSFTHLSDSASPAYGNWSTYLSYQLVRSHPKGTGK